MIKGNVTSCKTAKSISVSVLILFAAVSCNNRNPRECGYEAGKAACECYKIEDPEEREACLDIIDSTYCDFLDDTAFTTAVEKATIECLTEGVNDIVKPVNHHNTAGQTVTAQ